MSRFDPEDRPALQIEPLVESLSEHGVRWVLCGSQVLALHGAKLTPNDLDVVPDLSSDNLSRVAECLDTLGATAAYLDGWGGERGTYEACRAWRPDPPTAEHLDWLFVTEFGMLDIVIANADPYPSLMQGASTIEIGDKNVFICDPRRVLKALEPRKRVKDEARRKEYQRLRKKFGMKDLPPEV